jgi:LPXTG-site transpeptidase (sortase) family protein
MQETTKKQGVLGCLPQALWWNFLIGGAAWLLEKIFDGPYIYIEKSGAFFAFIFILFLFIIICAWCIFALKQGNWREKLVTSGPYRYSRHPIYSAIIFLLNPAFGILLRSWLIVFAALPAYFIWKKCAQGEESYLQEKFGEVYLAYKRRVHAYFPDLSQINKPLFYGVTALAIFLVSFISLNLPAFYLRWTTFDMRTDATADVTPKQKIAFVTPGQTPPAFYSISPQPNIPTPLPTLQPITPVTLPISTFTPSPTPTPNYVDAPNSIIIKKISLNAPLVFATGTTQKELNDALNLGVLIYPGSVLPGQNGEVILTGHSSVFPWVKTQYGLVFTLLDKLEAGDMVTLIYNHAQYDYRVTSKEILAPDDVKITITSKPVLTLTTCWPIGTAAKRLVVHTELIR